MRHTVKLHGVIVGYSELEHRDETDGRAWGAFRPGLGYELVQPIFQLYADAVPQPGGEPRDQEKLDRYHAARDKLGLQLVDATGAVVPTSAIHIADYRGSGGGLDLEVLMMNRENVDKG